MRRQDGFRHWLAGFAVGSGASIAGFLLPFGLRALARWRR